MRKRQYGLYAIENKPIKKYKRQDFSCLFGVLVK
jgi:hypothetical protein